MHNSDEAVVRNRWNRIKDQALRHDGLVLFIGCCAFLLGVLLDVFLLRLLCLGVVLISSFFVTLSLRGKGPQHSGVRNERGSPHQPQRENEEMKKLVFDDFQSDSGGRYVVEEIAGHEMLASGGAAPEPAPAPAAARSFGPITPETKLAPREFHVEDFFDVGSDFFRGSPEPKSEFNFLLTKVLMMIKETVFAHSVVFFWANRDKQQMVMEARVSDSASLLTSRRFAAGHDIVSKIAETGQPELITDVNPVSEPELLRYYDSQAQVKSFVGVPVFYATGDDRSSARLPVAVIAVDSTADGAFGEETLTLLGQFTKLISGLIKSYTDKYDLLLDSEVLSAVKRMQERLRSDSSQQAIMQVLAEETSKLVSWDFLSIVLFDEKKNAWVAKKVVNRAHEGYIGPEQAIDFPDSIVGQTIKNNLHTLVETSGTSTLPRYHRNEHGGLKGSFLSVPVSTRNRCYGALSVESMNTFNYSKQDVDMLFRLAENAGAALEILYLNEVIQEYVVVDDITGVYSKKFFLQRIGEELQRADECGSELSFLMITVDHASDLMQKFAQEGFDRIMSSLAKAIRASVRTYDVVGRLDHNRFGALLVNTAANDAYLWAEKLRKNVAAHVIAFDDKNFSITISAGVCGALEGMKKEELLGNTVTVLHKALEAGGNTVRVF